MISEQTVKDIDAAIQAIRKRGWTTGAFQDQRGRVCLVGALRFAVSGNAYMFDTDSGQWQRYEDLKSLVGEVAEHRLTSFNDKASKRKVIKALKAARVEATKGV